MRKIHGIIVSLALVACGQVADRDYQRIAAPIDSDGKADGVVVPTLQWDSVNNVFPYSAPYTVEANYSAGYCELWVNGLGRGNFSNGGATSNWIEAYVSTPPQWGEVLNAGMYVRTASGRNFLVFGSEIEPDYWQTGYMRTTDEAQEIAFFVDVRWPSGTVARLWQSNAGSNYSVSNTFSLSPSNVVRTGGGSITYASTAAPIFDQKRACDF